MPGDSAPGAGVDGAPPAAECCCDPAFLRWCAAGGLRARGVAPAFVAEGWRGVVATRRLAPGDVMVAAPLALLMTTRSARRDPQLGPLLARPEHARLSDRQVLAAHLLHEASKSPGSFWHLYIRQLPRSYSTLLCFPPEAAAALQAPHAVQAAAEAVEAGKADWRGAWRLLQDLGLPKKWSCWGAWQWAASTVLTRTMYLPWDSVGALTPFGDLFNYRPPSAPFTPRLRLPRQRLPGGTAGGAGAVGGGAAAGTGAGATSGGQEPQAGPTGATEGGSPAAAAAAPANSAGDAPMPLIEGAAATQPLPGPSPKAASTIAAADAGAPGPAEAAAAAATQPELPEESNGMAAARPDAAAGAAAAVPAHADAAGAPAQGGSPTPQPALPATPAPDSGEEGSDSCDGSDSGSGGGGGGSDDVTGVSGDGALDEAEGVYKLYARTSYEPGEQVFLCYGRHTNLELLELYGFCLPPGAGPGCNPHDTASLPPEAFAAAFPRRARSRGGPPAPPPPPPAADCWLHWDGRPSWGLLCALRRAAASDLELRERGRLALEGRPISREGDARAAAWVRAAAAAALAALPTTVEQDEAELAALTAAGGSGGGEGAAAVGGASALAECMRLALAWRAGHKRILQRGAALGL